MLCYTHWMKYQAVLFDMDGVVVDSEPVHEAAFRVTLRQYGHRLSENQYKQHFLGRTDEAGLQSYFDFVGETVDFPVVLDTKAREYLKLAADQLVPYLGALAFIRDLRARDIPLALVTGSLRAEADIVLKSFDLMAAFSAVIAAEDIHKSKPDPEGYLKGAAALGVAAEDCVVIEDAPSGVKAARAAGIRCVAVTNTHVVDELSEATFITNSLHAGLLEQL